MNIQVALVYGDPRYWVDRQIMALDDETQFTHAAFVVSSALYGQPMWYDIHFRWLISDWREFPAKNYAWDYSLWDIKNLTQLEAFKLEHWIRRQSPLGVNYDFAQCAFLYVAHKLGFKQAVNPFDGSKSYQCFESIARGLESIGRLFKCAPGSALAKDLVNSGYLELAVERVPGA